MTDRPQTSRVSERRLGLGLGLSLAVAAIPLAFRSGSYFPRSWLPVSVGLAAAALVLVTLGPRVRLSRGQVVVLALFGAQAAWTVASVAWAGSRANAWEEADRTLFYFVGFGLAVIAVRWAGGPGLLWLSVGALASIGAVALATIGNLALSADLARLFAGGQLYYPVTYYNGLAALLMIGFWLGMALSVAHTRAWWPRVIALAGAVVLLELAVLPQSRGAFWSFVLVTPWFIVVAPRRLRAVLHLAIVGLAVVWAWGALVGVRAAGLPGVEAAIEASAGGADLRAATRHALLHMAVSTLGALVAGTAVALLERRMSFFGPTARRFAGRGAVRWARRIGAVLIVVALLGVIAGLLVAGSVDDLSHDARQVWNRVTSDAGPDQTASPRFGQLGFSGRLMQWRVAWRAFLERPVLGLGAQNYEFYFFEHRPGALTVRQPHSQPMQLLSELGLAGFALWVALAAATVARGTRVRRRATEPATQAAAAAALLAVASWLIHSSADWLWQLGGVTWPAILLMGGLVGAGGVSYAAGPSHEKAGRAASSRGGGSPAPVLVGVAALGLLLSGSVYYLSLEYIDSASRGSTPTDDRLEAARTAGRLVPVSPAPAVAAAFIFEAAAQEALTGGEPGRAWVVLDDLALAASAWEEAVGREPPGWVLSYRAGLAVLDYRDAAQATGVLSTGPGMRSGSLENVAPASNGAPWAELAASEARVGSPVPGAVGGSLATTPGRQQQVQSFRTLSWDGLTARARTHLERAARLNPLEPRMRQVLEALG